MLLKFSLVGRIQDPSGAVIPGAEVQMKFPSPMKERKGTLLMELRSSGARERLWVVALLCLALVAQVAPAADPSRPRAAPHTSFSVSYLDALIGGFERILQDLPAISRAAEGAASRLLAGGGLFIASVRHDFVSEGMVRSGGLQLLREYGPAATVTEKDAVILGWSNTTPDQDLALARKLHESGAFVIGIGPKPPRQGADLLANVSVFLESSPPLPRGVLERFKGESYPVISQQNIVLLWVMTGEVVAALTRHGRMPVMFQSVLVTGARERNARFRGQLFHKEHSVPPIPAGQLGAGYLDRLGAILRALRNEEATAIDQVARACMDVRKAGHNVQAWLISHYPHYQPGAPGDPELIQPLTRFSGEVPPVDEVARVLKPGDLFLFIGYYRRPVEVYEAARRAGAKIVEVITGTTVPETMDPQPDYVIHPKWPYGDSLVPVPGYDVKILPSSGIVQAAIYWAVAGSMAALATP